MENSKSDITITYDRGMGWFMEESVVENYKGKILTYLCEHSLLFDDWTGNDVFKLMCEMLTKDNFYKGFIVNIKVISKSGVTYRKTIDRTAEM